MTGQARGMPLALVGLCFGLGYIVLFLIVWLPLRGVLEIQSGTNQGDASSHVALAITAVVLTALAAHALRAREGRLALPIAVLAIASVYGLIVWLALGDPGSDAVAVMVVAAPFLCPVSFPLAGWLTRRSPLGRL